jgi:hypothetical protein
MSRSFQRGKGVAAEHAGEAGEALPGDGIALVWHGAAAFLALGEGFLGFEHLGALEVAEFDGPTLDARANEGKCGLKFGMDVALDNLGGNRRRLQAEPFADCGFNRRGQVGAGANGTGQLAHGHPLARGHQTFECPVKFIVHERQLEAKGRRLGVDAVAAADAGRELVFARLFGDGGAQGLHVLKQDVRRLHHLDGERSIADVAAGQAEMEPAAGRAFDFLGNGGGEGDDVVIEDFLQFLLPRHEAGQIGKPLFRAGFDFGEVGFGHDAFSDERFGSEEFDLQPEAKLVFIRPDGPHFRA